MDARERILFHAQVGDLKDTDYRHTLALATILEVLVAKGIITREEVATAARLLDRGLPGLAVMEMLAGGAVSSAGNGTVRSPS